MALPPMLLCLPTFPSSLTLPATPSQMAQGLTSTSTSSHLTPCLPAQSLPLQCSQKFPATNRQQLPQQHSPAQGQARLPLLRISPSSGRQSLVGGSSSSFLAPPCHHRPCSIFTFLCRSSVSRGGSVGGKSGRGQSVRGHSALPTPSASPQLAETQRSFQKQRRWLAAPLVPGRTPLRSLGPNSRGFPPRCTSGMPAVERWDECRRGPLSEGAMREGLRAEGYSVTRYVFPPGTVFDYHDHGVSKKDCVLSGRFLFRMGGQDVVLGPGDMIEVPAGELHYAAVVGTEPVVFFDASKR